ncbi:uncharacterized protein LOC115483292 isoform X2 [Drosophila hydei]|nr:uncharacterized protein LOC115483292 isoform X2 [Drosophila hydei]
MRRQRKAARIIQHAWSRYIGRRHLILVAQDRTQESLQILYYNASLKIQSFFRGWWSRKHVNNLLFLKNMQLQCVEELLHSYALKLRRMMRTGELPGYIDFNKQKEYTKVKDILTALTYRFYNRYVCNKYMTVRTQENERQREFMDAVLRTWVPYSGFNHNAACQRWTDNFDIVPKVYALREYDVAQFFMSQTRTQLNTSQKKSMQAKRQEMKVLQERQFCRDVANSMRFWSVCNACKGKLVDSVMTKQFKEYLADIKSDLEAMDYMPNCNCTCEYLHQDTLNSQSALLFQTKQAASSLEPRDKYIDMWQEVQKLRLIEK